MQRTKRLCPKGLLLSGTLLFLATLCLAASPSASAQDPALAIETELLLSLRLEGQTLGVDVIGYQRDGEFLVSLEELMDGLQFPITVDAPTGRAGGWFIREEREFLLDLPNQRVLSDAADFVPGDDVVFFEGDLFVTVSALEQWFPLRLEPIVRQLILNVVPEETIPLQERLARMSRTLKSPSISRREAELPLQPNPYRLIGPHATDIRASYSNVRREEGDSPDLSLSYSLLSRGDLGWMTSSIALTGRDEDEITDARLRLERSDLDGPLNLNHVEIGDVNPRGGGDRGLLIRGGGSGQGQDGFYVEDTADLRGEVPPDWEVELYRNGVLLDFQLVGDDAQYEFLEVPLELGENLFEFVLYGPFGEVRREQETIFVGRDQLGFGNMSYELSATQAGRSVFDLNPTSSRGDRGSGRYRGRFNLGLSRAATATFAVDSALVDGRRLEDYDAGLSLGFSGVRTGLNYRYSPDRLDEGSVSIRSRLSADTAFNLGYSQSFTDGLDTDAIPENRRLWNASLGLSSRLWDVIYNLDAGHAKNENSSNSRASLGTTLSLGRGNRVSNTFGYDRNDRRKLGGELEQQTRGTLSFSTSLRPISLRLGVGYGIAPETEVQSAFSSATVRIDNSMSLNFNVNHIPQTDFTSYRGGYSWLLEQIRITPQVSYDSDERWTGLISISTSINPQPGRWMPAIDARPQSSSGAVRARVYVDHDGDGKLGPDDAPLEGVRVDAVQSWRRTETGADGQAYLTRLNAGRRTDIAIDPGSLPDFELQPDQSGRSIVPRPGSWSMVDFPVSRRSELEGHVYQTLDGADGRKVPAERIVVSLVDDEGEVISRQRTAFDGFYLFSGVKAGQYEVRLREGDRPRVLSSPDSVTVGASGGVIRSLDFLLRPAAGRTLIEEPAVLGQSPTVKERELEPFASPDGEAATLNATPAEEPSESLAQPPAPVVQPVEPATENGGWRLQLGAFSQRATAVRAWQSLSDTQAALLEGLEPMYQPIDNLTRLLAQPGMSRPAAQALCEALKAEGQDCLVRKVAE